MTSIDRQIAEQVLGWRAETGDIYGSEQTLWYTTGPQAHRAWYGGEFRPTEDIRAAMLVVEHFRAQGFMICLQGDAGPRGMWLCQIGGRAGAIQRTLPLAICRAALAPIGEE